MRVDRAVLREVPLELKEPFESSTGRVGVRRVLLLTLAGEGLEGWSECVAGAAPSYTYETTDTAWHVLTDFVLPGVVGCEIRVPGDVLSTMRWMRGHPMARATVEMAAWDLLARSEGVSLAAKLGGERERIPVGVSLGLRPSLEGLVEAVARYLEEGYRRVKLKIEPGRDVDMLARLRGRFPEAALAADANASYTLADASRLRELDELTLEMLEQPLSPDDFLGHAKLQDQMRTSICLDESVTSVEQAALALELGSCRIVNVKPGRVGGHGPATVVHDLWRDAGLPAWCGGMLESGVGRAHSVALASLPGFSLPGDLSASRRYWERDIVSPEFEVVDGHLHVPTDPGIGVEVDVDRLDSLAVRTVRFP